jgi:sugar lactone lactonase YvrE
MFRSLSARHRSRSRVTRGYRLHVHPLEDRSVPTAATSAATYGQISLSFEANEGQAAPQVNYLARGPGFGLFLSGTEAVLSLAAPNSGAGNTISVKLIGANSGAVPVVVDKLASTSNYFLGTQASGWIENVPNYGRVEYPNIYPGIGVIYYGNQQTLEYDFQVAPGADPGKIRLAFGGIEGMSIDAQGDVVLRTSGGNVVEKAPVLYQQVGGTRRPVTGSYVVEGENQVGFAIGPYDHSRPLTIDPVVSYSTYLGGSGQDQGFAIVADSSGAAYITGETPSTNFPTANPFQPSYSGGAVYDAFVAKLNPAGTALVYSTYLGGTGTDAGFGIAVDASGDAYATGETFSNNFPTTANALQGTLAGDDDAFVTELNPTGSALVYSTYLGGASQDYATSIAVNASGDAFVTGLTQSGSPGQAFPTVNPVQSTLNGSANAFVSELNSSGTALVYSTFLGGSTYDHGSGIALDASGDAFVTGYTESSDFPTTTGALQATFGSGTDDAFVTELNPAGSALVYSTFLGGNGNDEGNGIAVDSSGDAYVTGSTESTNFPTVNPAQSSFAGGTGAGGLGIYGGDAFVSKLNPTGSALDYSTYLGGSNDDIAWGIAVDKSGSAYITGETDSSSDFPTTANALQPTYGGPPFDAFVTRLTPAGNTVDYSSFLGGSGTDIGQAIALNSAGDAYVTGYTIASDFPTANAFQATSGGAGDAFVTRISDFPEPATVQFSAAGETVEAATGGFNIPVTLAGDPVPTVSTFATGLSNPQGLAVDANGNIYVANYGAGTVSKITPAGAVSQFASGFGSPTSLAFDAGGNLYVANFGFNSISKVTRAGTVTTFVSNINNPAALSFDRAGNLYVANLGNTGQPQTVSKVTPAGGVSVFASGFIYPSGLAFDAAGNLYVANETNANVEVVDRVTPGGVVTPFASGFALPDSGGLAFDTSGNLYVSSYGGNYVSKVTPDGSISTYVSEVNQPCGLTFANGKLYLADSGNTISQVDGTVTVPFTLGGTAVAGTDYAGVTSSPLVFATGQSEAAITGHLAVDPGPNKTLALSLGTPTGAALGSPAVNTLTISESAIATQPKSQTVHAGQMVTFTSTAAVPAIREQWQVSIDGGSTFTTIKGASRSSLSVRANEARDGEQFRAVFTFPWGIVDSNAATLTVLGPPEITLQPARLSVAVGGTATFTAAASANPVATWQWQSIARGTGTFTNLAGQTSPTLTLANVALTDTGTRYRVIVSNTLGRTISTVATLYVDVAPQVTVNPTDQQGSAGETVEFKAAASGTPLPKVQWQVSADGGTTFETIRGATGLTFRLVAQVTDNGDQYRAVFTNPVGTVSTNAAQLTVTGSPVVTIQPKNQTVGVGDDATFTAGVATNPAATVQWQVKPDGASGFTDLSGQTSPTLELTNLAVTNSGALYRAVFTNALGSATTAAAVLVVTDKPIVTAEPARQIVAAGGTATFTATAVGSSPISVQWEVKARGAASYTNISGATSNVLTLTGVSSSDAGNVYRAVFKNAAGIAVTAAASLIVEEPPQITLQPASTAVGVGQTVVFTAAASGTPGTVQWQVSTDGGATYQIIPGARGTILRVASRFGESGYRFRAVFTNLVGQAITDGAELLLY